jgi:hypothetical protein
MAILTGFPPSNTIQTGIRFPKCVACGEVGEWADMHIAYYQGRYISFCKKKSCREAAAINHPQYKEYQMKESIEIRCKETPKEEVNYCVVKDEGVLEEIILINLDVGQLPPDKVDTYVSTLLKKWKPLTDRLPNEVGLMIFPKRLGNETCVQTISI